ncbi:unnamed protein product [Schistosoma curassoni]|uniref:GATA zinc finger domain-containing protein 14-like n=1 Tax=Schistosoma curassoni TaxID=6186 RepID=A0A183JC65_9TREM|nr:unnamed protein product [Schistosoma curassoni]
MLLFFQKKKSVYHLVIPVDKGYVQKNIFGRRYYGNNNMKFYQSGSTGTGGGGGGGGGNVYNYYGRKRGRTYNRHYYHEGQRAYNNNNNNNRSRYPFTCSPTVYPLSRSQSSYNIDSDINNNNSNDNYHYDYKNHGRVHRYSNCSYTMNNEQLTDEYIDDCLSTDIEQYQLKLDMNDQYIHHNYKSKHLTITNNDVNNVDDWTKVKTSSPSSSTSSSSSSSSPSTDSDFVSNDISQPSSSSSPSASSSPSSTSSSSSNHQIINSHLHNESKQLQHKCKSSLNLSTSCIIVYDTNNNEDYIDVNHIHDNVENQRESIEYDNNQKDCK